MSSAINAIVDQKPAAPQLREADIAVIGAGLAGTIAAIRLHRMGYRVALFDLHGRAQPEFRAEQLVGRQIGRLEDLGLIQDMTRESRPAFQAVNARLGRALDRTPVRQYGVPYEAMVAGVRRNLPDAIPVIAQRVKSIETSADRQRVVLGDGSSVEARLVVLASGLASVLTKRLGIENRMIRANHSLAIAFDVTLADPAGAADMPLIYYGEQMRDRIDYIALFRMHDVIRANLFCYWEQQSDWTRGFCREPDRQLQAMLPGLRTLTGDYTVSSPVQVRSNDLRVAQDPARDGVVVIGDAFQTPCPSAGTGIDRLLSDVDTLCDRYVRAWFASPGMGTDKIAAYYADPGKRAADAECLRIAEYRRAVSTRETLRWKVHRRQVFLRRRLKGLLSARTVRSREPLLDGTMAPSR